MLARFDIDVVLHRTSDGRIHGATFIDHSTKCAFKGSDLGSFRLDDVIAADEGGQWNKRSSIGQHDTDSEMGILGAALAGISKSNSKSQEKDMKDKKKKRKLKR
jgi:hypothetical protein